MENIFLLAYDFLKKLLDSLAWDQPRKVPVQLSRAINDSYVVSKVPGYRKYQLIFLYYLRKYGICKSFLISLAFPLPFTILFYALSGYLQHLEIKN